MLVILLAFAPPGHESPKTTDIYTLIGRWDLTRIHSPLDDLKKEQRADKGKRLVRWSLPSS